MRVAMKPSPDDDPHESWAVAACLMWRNKVMVMPIELDSLRSSTVVVRNGYACYDIDQLVAFLRVER